MTRRVLVLVSLALVAGACRNATTVSAPGSPVARSVTVTGLPATLFIGDAIQLRAQASFSDGHSEDVTATVRWSSSALTCLVTPGGVVSAISIGACSISAALGTVTGGGNAAIAPAQHFTISGTVRERFGNGEPGIPGATATVTSGTQAGRQVVTDAQGRFSIPGVPVGPVALRVQAADFEARVVDVFPDRPMVDVLLTVELSTVRIEVGDQSLNQTLILRREIPITIRHRGPAQITAISDRSECGTFETFEVYLVTAAGKNVQGTSPCQRNIPTTVTFDVDPGDYRLVVVKWIFAVFSTSSAELKHPK